MPAVLVSIAFRLFCKRLSKATRFFLQVHGIIELPCEACVDQDHEAMLHDIIRLPHEVRVDYDHESQIHDIMKLPHEVRVDQDHEAMLHDII